jgi:hypothetical protein
MTPEEASLLYTKYIADGTRIEQNLAIFSNEELTKLMNQSNTIQTASIKQYATNIENGKKDIHNVLNAALKPNELMEHSKKHSMYDKVTLDVSSIDRAPYDTIFLNRESLLN